MANLESDVQDIAHFVCIWTIENMCERYWMCSPIFNAQVMHKSRWFLRIECDRYSGFIGIAVERAGQDKGPDSIELKFELSLLGMDGLKLPLIKKQMNKQFFKNDSFKFRKFAIEDEVFVQRRAEFLPRDALKIGCRMWRTGAKISEPEECFVHTFLREFRGSCILLVREFSSLLVGQKRKVFLDQTEEETIPLNLHCFIREEEDEQYVCIDIRNSEKVETCKGKIKIGLQDAKGNIVQSKEGHKEPYRPLVFENFVEKRKLLEDRLSLLADDVLSLRFEYQFAVEVLRETVQYLSSSELEDDTSDMIKIDFNKHDDTSIVPSSITEAMKTLFQEGSLSDVILRAGSKSFPAHKCILYIRSPVFRTIFSEDIKEKTSKYVDIPDLDEETLRELLSYIYTDRVGELEWKGATNLYKAADKYKLAGLKTKCITALKSDLSVNNVCAVLTVADLHNDRELLEAAQDFIMRQGSEFIKSDTWRNLAEKNIKLAMGTMDRLLYLKYLDR